MKKQKTHVRFSPLDPVVHWKNPGTFVWIPGTHWQVCVWPTFLDFVCLQSGLRRRFAWNIENIEKFEGQFLLQKGKISLLFYSPNHYLQIVLWADTSCHPCLEIARHNGVSELEISWDQGTYQLAETKNVYAVSLAQQLLRKPSQLSPQNFPVLWFGTNKQLDFDKFGMGSCPWLWSYAILMAARFLPHDLPCSNAVWPFASISENQDWSKLWISDWAKASKGLFCFDSQRYGFWNSALEGSLGLKPLEALKLMAKSFYQKWLEFDLDLNVINIDTQAGFTPPAGRLEFNQGGLKVYAYWRAYRLQELCIESKLDRKLTLSIRQLPKSVRCHKKENLQLGKTKSLTEAFFLKPQGKLLDLELLAGAHYQLDRFEY